MSTSSGILLPHLITVKINLGIAYTAYSEQWRDYLFQEFPTEVKQQLGRLHPPRRVGVDCRAGYRDPTAVICIIKNRALTDREWRRRVATVRDLLRRSGLKGLSRFALPQRRRLGRTEMVMEPQIRQMVPSRDRHLSHGRAGGVE